MDLTNRVLWYLPEGEIYGSPTRKKRKSVKIRRFHEDDLTQNNNNIDNNNNNNNNNDNNNIFFTFLRNSLY